MASPAIPILFGGLIAWSFYRRVRRNIGRQKLRPRRFVVSLVIFGLISSFVLYASLHNLNLLLGFGGGLLLGALLGLLGLRLTKFETTRRRPFLHAGYAHRHRHIHVAHRTVALPLLGDARCFIRAEPSAADAKPADLFHHRPDLWLLHRLLHRLVCSHPRQKAIVTKLALLPGNRI